MEGALVADLGPVVEEVVCDVLSAMCFAAPEFAGDGVIEQPIASAIQFSGEISGELRIALAVGLAKQLTADFLGVEPAAVSLESASEFTLELANVLCGAALMVAAGERQFEYEVALPSAIETVEKQAYEFCFAAEGSDPDVGVDFRIVVSGA